MLYYEEMFSFLLEKKGKRRSRILDRKGQGTVEYVLLVALSVAIILGLMNQLYKPFNTYLNNYMGSYLQCLLDAGELPTLGYDAGDSVCNAEFQPFTLGEGRTPLTNNNPGNTTPTPSDRSDPAARSPTQNSSPATSASGRRAAGSSTRIGNNGTGADGAGSEGSNVQKIPTTESDSSSGYFRVSGASGYRVDAQGRRVRAVGVAGLLASEREQLEREDLRIKRMGSVEDGTSQGKPKKMRVKAPERKVASAEEDSPWTFGKFIRFALILMLIIAIILFLGGQALQISKGMDS